MRLKLYRGKWCVYWRGASGEPVRRSLGTADRAEADRRFADFQSLQLARAANPEGKVIAQLWEDRRLAYGDRPIARTMKYTGVPIIKFFGHLEPRHVTEELCKQYEALRLSQGRKPGTVHTELTHLASVLNRAKAGGHVVRPPAPPPKDLYLTKRKAAQALNIDDEA